MIGISLLDHGRFDRTLEGTNTNNQTTNVEWSFGASSDTFTFSLILSSCFFFLEKQLGKILLEDLTSIQIVDGQ